MHVEFWIHSFHSSAKCLRDDGTSKYAAGTGWMPEWFRTAVEVCIDQFEGEGIFDEIVL